MSSYERVRAALAAICERIEGGTHINHACALEGVPRRSLYALIESDEECATLVAKSRAVAAETMRERVLLVAEGLGEERANANVLLHLLERAHPEEWAPAKQRIEQTGADGGPVAHRIDVVDKLAPEELLRAAKAILGSTKEE